MNYGIDLDEESPPSDNPKSLQNEPLFEALDPSLTNPLSVCIQGGNTDINSNTQPAKRDSFLLSRKVRYGVGVFIALLCTGAYFSYDAPSSMAKHLEEIPPDINNMKLMILYSLYSWPNVVMSFIGGFLVDRLFGLRWGTVIFSLTVVSGHFLVCLGLFLNHYWLMCIGRFIFGIGGESLQVTQNSFVVKWFGPHGELNTVFGMMLSFARLGSSLSFLILPVVYNSLNSNYDLKNITMLGITFMIALLFCFLSLTCAGMLNYVDLKHDVALGKVPDCRENETLINESTYGAINDNVKAKNMVHFTDVQKFSLSFFAISAIIVFYYIAIFPFVSISSLFLQKKYNYDNSTAGDISSIIYIVSGIASPLFGFLIDKVGYNVYWVQLGIVISLLAHLLLSFTYIPPIVEMIILGIGFSIVSSSLWPMISMTIDESHLSTAYGLAQSIQNLGLAIFAIFVGFLSNKFGYFATETAFIIAVSVALLMSILLYMDDLRNGEKLNMSQSRRRKILLAEQLINETTDITTQI